MEIYIGRLPKRTTISHLRAFFKGYFKREAGFRIINLSYADGGRCSYGLVDIEPERLARKAIKKLNGKKLNGVTIDVRDFHHRSSNNERRAVGWRGQEWQEGEEERRRTERRRRILDQAIGNSTEPEEKSEEEQLLETMKVTGYGSLARKL